jgi:hypothetical protein
LVKPVIVHERVAVLQVFPPLLAVTVYPVTSLPPLSAGAVQDTVARALPPPAETLVGVPGTVAGTTGADGADGDEAPLALPAVTVKV